MNIYGFVASLLIIFAIATHSMMHKTTTFSKTQISYQGYMKASRDIDNQLEKERYKRAKRKSYKKRSSFLDKKTSSLSTPSSTLLDNRQEKVAKKPKIRERSPACSRLNIALLIEKGPDGEKELMHLFERLIVTLYKEAPFYPVKEKNFSKKIATAIIAAAHEQFDTKNRDVKRLEKLQLPSPSLQSIYYQMLKGTDTPSSNEQKKDFPSLLDFVKIQEPKVSKICISCAPIEILKTLYSEKIAKEIMQKKMNKETPLTDSEIQFFVNRSSHIPSKGDPSKFIRPSCKKKRTYPITLTGEDKKSGVRLQKRILLEK